jgi:hypothetical protein
MPETLEKCSFLTRAGKGITLCRTWKRKDARQLKQTCGTAIAFEGGCCANAGGTRLWTGRTGRTSGKSRGVLIAHN